MIETQNIILPFKMDIFDIGSISNRETEAIIGIYKITAPDGKINIGQSTDIENRFLQYKGFTSISEEVENSLKHYGIKNHIFEIIHICDSQKDLPELETFYINKFDCVYPKGLNKDKKGKIGRPSKLQRLEDENTELREIIENHPKVEENNERSESIIMLFKKHNLISKIDDEIDRLNKCHNRKLTEISEYYFEARTFLSDLKNKINEITEI